MKGGLVPSRSVSRREDCLCFFVLVVTLAASKVMDSIVLSRPAKILVFIIM